MDYIANGFIEALRIVVRADAEFVAIVTVSLLVALTSTSLAAATGRAGNFAGIRCAEQGYETTGFQIHR